MQFKLAILSVLARRSDGRATLDELRDEAEILAANEDDPGELSSTVDELDIFQSGLVTPEDGGLRITDAGRSALRAMEDSNDASLDFPSAPPFSPSLKAIDDLIGTEERRKIFDLDLREPGEAVDGAPGKDVEGANGEDAADGSRASPQIAETIPIDPPPRAAPDAPAFLLRGFGSRTHAGGQRPARREGFLSLIGDRLKQMRWVWQRHLELDAVNAKSQPRTGNVGGGVIALLTLLIIVICAGAVFAFVQIKALKSEVTTLQRELSPLKERLAKADRDKATKSADRPDDAQNRTGSEKSSAAAAPRGDQPGLSLSPEDIQLVRTYIKPAPAAGTPASAISPGDIVSIPTIALPSQLTEKIPKLLGARFTIRNGSIIILKRDSRHADVVLPPN